MSERRFEGDGKPDKVINPRKDLPSKSPPQKSAGEVHHRLPTPEEVLKRGIDRILEKRERKKSI